MFLDHSSIDTWSHCWGSYSLVANASRVLRLEKHINKKIKRLHKQSMLLHATHSLLAGACHAVRSRLSVTLSDSLKSSNSCFGSMFVNRLMSKQFKQN